MLWQRFPLLRLFLALCTGIVLGNTGSFSPGPLIFIVAVLVAALVLAGSKWVFFRFRFRAMFGVLLMVFFIFLGMLSCTSFLKPHKADTLERFTRQGVYMLQLTEAPVNKGYAWRCEAKVTCVDSSYVHTKALLYVQADSTHQNHQPQYGDQYWFKGKLSFLDPPKNPYSFDYKGYLNARAIYLTGFISFDKVKRFRQNSMGLRAWSIRVRNHLLSKIEAWELPAEQEQISKALLVGYKDEVNTDLLSAYSAVGAMHVLAVSGLHMGILYLVLSRLFFFLRTRKARLIKALLIVCFLWVYALITGLSPSVVRAATMFTFVAVGVSFQRNTSVYNTLLASAFLLLLIKPVYLFEVGFQLSYVAVLGIVWLQPVFQKWWKPQGWVLRFVWDMISVSLAAQIATFPLALFYFHQFPGLFLLSNLIVLPLVTVLMYLGFALLVLGGFAVPVSWLVHVYSKVLWTMNSGVRWIEGLEAWVFDALYINPLEVWLLYVFIILFLYFLLYQKYGALLAAMGAAILLQLSQLIENYTLSKHAFVAYALPEGDAFAFRKGSRLYFVADSNVQANEPLLNYQVKPHWAAQNVEEVIFLQEGEEYRGGAFFQDNCCQHFGGLSVIRDPKKGAPSAAIWWLTTFHDALPEHPPERVMLLSNRMPEEEIQRCRRWAAEKKVAVHVLSEAGAWELQW
jgi:competence protein ComEC